MLITINVNFNDAGSEEVWKEIPDFPEYEISNRGRIKSWKLGANPRVLKEGSKAYHLWRNGTRHYKQLRNLMLEAFGVVALAN